MPTPTENPVLWAIVLAPLIGAAAAGLLALMGKAERIAPYVTIAATAVSGIAALLARPSRHAGHLYRVETAWLTIGDSFRISLAVYLDALAWVMVGVVCAVSLLVQIYSIGYMRGERGYARYFSFLALFTASMLGLVVADNLFQLYVCWELVGICSYLLIGFWWHKPSAASAAKKAFVVTRFGDVGFMLGLLLLAVAAGSFDFQEVQHSFMLVGSDAQHGSALMSNGAYVWLVPLLLFCGAVGKSAQFPLHVWLPDAMEGPTPVSALIHAATMVAAGVYMVARLIGLFTWASVSAPLRQSFALPLDIILLTGAITALIAATIALVQTDIKKVLAYSTVSQLGFMMMALGAGNETGQTSSVFHLVTHAFFKALLFLAAGAVIHALHHAPDPNDLRQMGGLGRRMPWTAATCLVGVLALSGLPPFSGFWSKDGIVGLLGERAGWFGPPLPTAPHVEFGADPAVASLAAVVALGVTAITAFYSFRLWMLAFAGTPRSQAATHAREAAPVMVVPLVLLAIPSVAIGWWLHHGDLLAGYITGAVPAGEAHWSVAVLATVLALAGAATAIVLYCRNTQEDAVQRMPRPVYQFFANLWYVEAFWSRAVAPALLGVARGVAWFDRNVVDGAVRGSGRLTVRTGIELRRLCNGQSQAYATTIVAATVLIIVLLVLYEAAASGSGATALASGMWQGARVP